MSSRVIVAVMTAFPLITHQRSLVQIQPSQARSARDTPQPSRPSHTAERPPVSLAAAAVQARGGPARPEGAIGISRNSETASGFLKCESGVRVTPGRPIYA